MPRLWILVEKFVGVKEWSPAASGWPKKLSPCWMVVLNGMMIPGTGVPSGFFMLRHQVATSGSAQDVGFEVLLERLLPCFVVGGLVSGSSRMRKCSPRRLKRVL